MKKSKRKMKKPDKKSMESKKVGTMAFLKFLALMFPLVMYLLVIVWLFPAPNSGFIALGVFGSMIMGLGAVHVVGLIDDTYLGHILTAILFGIGGLLVAISSVIMYVPQIYASLNEKHVTFYFIAWSYLIVSGIYYMFFRNSVSLDLRKNGMSKTNIKEKMKGTKNYWWYNELKDYFSHPCIFYTNRLFTLIFPFVSIFHLVLGWWSAVSLFILFLLIVVLLLDAAMSITIISTYDYRRSRSDRPRSSPLGTLVLVIFPIIAMIGLILYYIQ